MSTMQKMSNSRNLSAEEENELNDWLNLKRIVLNHRTRRDLSNVVNMALLFKGVNSKLVNMKNYTSHGSLEMKVLNWDTFNLNVLKKTGLLLMRPALEQLALGNLNALRSLLYHLMRIERDGAPIKSRLASPAKTDPPQSDAAREDTSQSAQIQDASIPTENQNQPNGQASRDLRIAQANCEELEYINENKEKIICALSQKVVYLEKIIVEKEKRIKELLDHLSTLSARIISMQATLMEDELPPPPPPSL